MRLSCLKSKCTSVFLGWPVVCEEILGQNNLPELLLRDCGGGGCSTPGWKQNSRDEFGLALFALPLPWMRFAPRGGQVGREVRAAAVVVSPLLARVLHQGGWWQQRDSGSAHQPTPNKKILIAYSALSKQSLEECFFVRIKGTGRLCFGLAFSVLLRIYVGFPGGAADHRGGSWREALRGWSIPAGTREGWRAPGRARDTAAGPRLPNGFPCAQERRAKARDRVQAAGRAGTRCRSSQR